MAFCYSSLTNGKPLNSSSSSSRVIKINVHGTTVEAPRENGNTNGIGVIARNYYGELLWGLMGPLKGVHEEMKVHLWAIHQAMKHAFKRRIPDVIIETDNIMAFDIIDDQDEEEIEFEDLSEVMQQINKLSVEYNKRRIDGSPGWNCELKLVSGTKNIAASNMSYHGMVTYDGLTEVIQPYDNLKDILDLDNGLGPNLEIFSVRKNDVNGEVIDDANSRPRTVFPRGVNIWCQDKEKEMGLSRRDIIGPSNPVKRMKAGQEDPVYPPGFELYTAKIEQARLNVAAWKGIAISDQWENKFSVGGLLMNSQEESLSRKGKGIVIEEGGHNSAFKGMNNMTAIVTNLQVQEISSDSDSDWEKTTDEREMSK